MKHTSKTLTSSFERSRPESAAPAPPRVVDTRVCFTTSVGETNTDSPVERTATVPPKSSCDTGVDTESMAPAFCRNRNKEIPEEQAERESVQQHSKKLIQAEMKRNVRGKSGVHPAKGGITAASKEQQHQSVQSKTAAQKAKTKV